MATVTDFTQDSVLYFLQSKGGTVKNSDLLFYFKSFLRDHEDRARYREQFKKFVNSVATVKQEEGVSYVVLRKKFRGHLPAVPVPGGGPSSKQAGRQPEQVRPRDRNPEKPTWQTSAETSPRQPKPPQRDLITRLPQTTESLLLPSAGILNNNNNHAETTNFNLVKPLQSSSPFVPECAKEQPHAPKTNFPYKTKPALPGATASHQNSKAEVALPEFNPRDQYIYTGAKLGHPNVPLDQHSRNYCPTTDLQPKAAPLKPEAAPLKPKVSPLKPEAAPLKPEAAPLTPEAAPLKPKVSPLKPEASPLKPEAAPLTPKAAPLKSEAAPLKPKVSPLKPKASPLKPEASPLTPKSAPLKSEAAPLKPKVSPLKPKAGPLTPEEIPKESGTGSRFDQQATRRRAKHRQSYKTAVSYDGGDFDDDEEEEEQRRPGAAGGAQPVNVPLGQMGRAIFSFSPCTSDPPAPLPLPPSTLPSTNLATRERNDNLPGCQPGEVPVICIWAVEEDSEATHGPGLELEPGLRMGQDPGDSKPLPSSLPFEPECHVPSPDRVEYTETYHDQSHHNQHVNLDPSEQRLDPGLESGLDPVLDSGLGPKLDPVLASGLDSGLGSRLDPGFGPGLRPKLGPGAGLSSSHNSVFPPSSEEYSSSDWPRYASPRGSEWDSSDEALNTSTGELDSEAKVQEMLQRAKETKLLALMHRAERKSTTPWHHSTGHLVDEAPADAASPPWHRSADRLHDDRKEEGAASSDSSTTSPAVRHRPSAARRVSSRLRSRMCRSLGAELDQHFDEDGRGRGGGGGGGAAARHNRLHLLSSSLSLRCSLSSSSLSSSCQSLSDLAEVEKGDEGTKHLPSSSSSAPCVRSKVHHQPDLVPLEPKEHSWLVKGAVGSWTDIYSLFREDPTLLNRRDFVTGYTVLHWIAKHGDHRVLNTLWYGVNKAGVTMDVDARSACGYTPLHLAALHGHKKMMRLLVHKFQASVALRDTSGKKAWQYVERPASLDVLHLLGAPQWAAAKRGAEEGGSQRLHHSASSVDKHHHRARPLTVSGTAKVKRSSSIAAFLKHKSILRLTGQFTDIHV